ncbi:metallophosphoesterase family protein [Clostridium thermobutyricum]|uniref:metallophosphoesterase family protein n=1 Tax=Clostridium thermobutyricum TaxID=29372 RepID=UPI0018AB4120|nr:metallophosphoesterase [Clostridium thermobutyricum]
MIRWLQISDIHFNFSNYSTKKMRDMLIKSIINKYTDKKFDFITITGDLAFRGGSYNKSLSKFILDLSTSCGVTEDNIFIVPGNHDLTRSPMRTRLITSITNTDNLINEVQLLDTDTLKELHKSQNKFWKMYKEITKRTYDKDSLHFIEKRDKFNIINLNTCLLCGQDNEEGNLSIFLNKLYDVLHNNLDSNKINVAIGHHNIECFCIGEQEKIINNFVDEGVDLYLCGHSHKPKVSVENNNDREFYIVMSGAGVVDDYAIPTYVIGEIENNNCSISYYSWDNIDEVWNKETKGLGRKAKDGIFSFALRNEISIIEDDKDIYIEEDDFKDFIIDFNKNVESKIISTLPLVKEEIEKKFSNMKCNSSVKKQFSNFSKYFPIIDEIMYDNSCLGMEKRIIIPNVICEEYNNTLNKFSNGYEILEEIVQKIYFRYRDKIRYSESKLKVYIKTLVFWLINECDIFDDVKE